MTLLALTGRPFLVVVRVVVRVVGRVEVREVVAGFNVDVAVVVGDVVTVASVVMVLIFCS